MSSWRPDVIDPPISSRQHPSIPVLSCPPYSMSSRRFRSSRRICRSQYRPWRPAVQPSQRPGVATASWTFQVVASHAPFPVSSRRSRRRVASRPPFPVSSQRSGSSRPAVPGVVPAFQVVPSRAPFSGVVPGVPGRPVACAVFRCRAFQVVASLAVPGVVLISPHSAVSVRCSRPLCHLASSVFFSRWESRSASLLGVTGERERVVRRKINVGRLLSIDQISGCIPIYFLHSGMSRDCHGFSEPPLLVSRVPKNDH